MASKAEQYRQLARDCLNVAQVVPPTERNALLEMAAEWDRLADQQEHTTALGQKE